MIDFFFSLYTYADWGLLALRFAIGIIFLYHCRTKVGGKMGGFMMFIGYAELLGGTAQILGFLTQLSAFGLSIIMLGAIYKKTQKWNVPFSAMDKTGWEFDLMILAGCIALITLGGGLIALDPFVFGL